MVHLMTDAQIWTMIGCFTALMFGMLTVVSTLFIRVVRTEIGGLHATVTTSSSSVYVYTCLLTS